jgi:hypothetical protein
MTLQARGLRRGLFLDLLSTTRRPGQPSWPQGCQPRRTQTRSSTRARKQGWAMWLRANACAARLAFRFVDENFDSLSAPAGFRGQTPPTNAVVRKPGRLPADSSAPPRHGRDMTGNPDQGYRSGAIVNCVGAWGQHRIRGQCTTNKRLGHGTQFLTMATGVVAQRMERHSHVNLT